MPSDFYGGVNLIPTMPIFGEMNISDMLLYFYVNLSELNMTEVAIESPGDKYVDMRLARTSEDYRVYGKSFVLVFNHNCTNTLFI